jgi:hypothetical protein
MTSDVAGWFQLYLTDDDPVEVYMHHCPALTETIVSPQHMCSSAAQHSPFSGFALISQMATPPVLQLHVRGTDRVVHAPLRRHNDLFYCARDSAPVVRSLRHKAVLAAELWHQRLGHPGNSQLSLLLQRSTGLPSRLASQLHPFHSCDACSDARPRRSAAGPTADTAALQPGTRFHVDFGFMRASSGTYAARKNVARVVTSVDGYNAYLLIADAHSRYTWIFLTVSKAPPTAVLDTFLASNKLLTGPRFIRMDQGGELWRSDDIRDVCIKHQYVAEPTGSDSPSQNGKVERLNGTYGVMVRAMLYSSGLHPKFWSAAVIHAVYLKNRHVHSATGDTPYFLWTGVQPDLSHLRIFGSLVTARKPGKSPSKLDRHASRGIFLGFGATTRHIRYWDVQTERIKLSNHHVFDEAHFGSAHRPPSAQLLFDLGMVDDPVPVDDVVPDAPADVAVMPPIPKRMAKLPWEALRQALPLSEFVAFPAAAVARLQVEDDVSSLDVMSVEMCDDPFGPSFSEPLGVSGVHPTAGLCLQFDSDRGRCRLLDMARGTPAHKLVRWRSRLRHAHVLAVEGAQVRVTADISAAVRAARDKHLASVQVTFAFDDVVNSLNHAGIPQLYFDQLRVIRRHIRAAAAGPKLSRRKLMLQTDWPAWEAAEFQQLDNYMSQHMFGDPVVPPQGAAIFYFVWLHYVKPHENDRKKVRGVCDGSSRGGAQVLGHTFAPTPDMIDFRMQVALSAIRGLTIYLADVSNAFAEADRPEQMYYMRVDDVFRNWWTRRFPAKPLLRGCAIPVHRNLQGHPEAPRMWSNHIDRILTDVLHLTSVTHSPCLYSGVFGGHDILFLRQVDDFAISCPNAAVYGQVCDALDAQLSVPMVRHGLITHFNGLDVHQYKTCTIITVESYLGAVLKSHGWESLEPALLPMDPDNKYVRLLDAAEPLSLDARLDMERDRFRYRGAIGELIWPMVTARPDIAFPAIKLSQFSVAPAALHFDAVLGVFRYLLASRDRGITFTRLRPVPFLPDMPPSSRLALPGDSIHDHLVPVDRHGVLYGYSDSDWAMDVRHRRSITGIVMCLAGGAVAWKCRVQPTVSLSTTEAEFLAASDAGRMALYLRSVLSELGHPQASATCIYEDNRGALLLSQASQPTRQTRHIDIRAFALLDWHERDVISLVSLDSSLNSSDLLTKQLARILFSRHWDCVSGLVFYYVVYPSGSVSLCVASRSFGPSSTGGCQNSSVCPSVSL